MIHQVNLLNDLHVCEYVLSIALFYTDTFKKLQVRPCLNNVLELLKGKSHLWTKIALALQVPIAWTEKSNESHLKTILEKWIEEECSEVTWRKVMEMLNTLGFHDELLTAENFLTTLSV